MIDFLSALGIAFGVVFVAELGDKTQLLALGFGTRYSLKIVAIGLTAGYAVANVLATIVGGVVGAALPERPIRIVAGIVFLVFAGLALRPDDEDDVEFDELDGAGASGPFEPTPRSGATTLRRKGSLAVIGSIALTIAIAEMGDKTQITTATLASQSSPVAVWLGATIGAASSGMIGAVVGRALGHRIDSRALRLGSAALFAIFGVAMLAGWL